MRFGMVIRGEYVGREGHFTEVNKYGNVMFYPVEGKHPYRVCLRHNDVKEVKKEGE
jgi:hypothetical protein